ncbi:thymidylate kinase [Candidatus Woesearchaeota archaeon B3_Woes]|nr:MAG: thymidylate kinase [Candidatus Woesearchaeota archaeon B3_Woes]
MSSGKLIVVDGTDGSGKATQTKLLVEKLKKENYDVEIIDFPRYGEKSAFLIEEYLNGKFGSAKETGPYVPSIFYACDRYVASMKIKEWLKQGKIVIANRYVASSMAHQGGKIEDKEERDTFLEWLEDLEFNIFKIPKPTANIILYVPPEIGQKLVDKKGHRDYVNGSKRDLHEEDLEHLKDATKTYRTLIEKYNWIVIECAPDNKLKTIEEIQKLLWDKAKDLL